MVLSNSNRLVVPLRGHAWEEDWPSLAHMAQHPARPPWCSAQAVPSPTRTHNSKHSASSQSSMRMGELVASKLPHFQETRRSASVPARTRAAVRITSFQLHQGLTCVSQECGAAVQWHSGEGRGCFKFCKQCSLDAHT